MPADGHTRLAKISGQQSAFEYAVKLKGKGEGFLASPSGCYAGSVHFSAQ